MHMRVWRWQSALDLSRRGSVSASAHVMRGSARACACACANASANANANANVSAHACATMAIGSEARPGCRISARASVRQ